MIHSQVKPRANLKEEWLRVKNPLVTTPIMGDF
jgi:hypothetical protein